MPDTTHISSLLLRAEPARLAEVTSAIAARKAAEVALSDPSGKIIVTLETDNEAEIVDHLNALSLLDGVVSAALVYHQTDQIEQP